MTRAARYLSAARWHAAWFLLCTILCGGGVILAAMAHMEMSGGWLVAALLFSGVCFAMSLHHSAQARHHLKLYEQAKRP